MPGLDDLNEAQREAATHIDGPCVVVAGAGSGKTSMLVTRVSELMKAGVPPNRILCCTFTRKATQEMRARIEKNVGRNGKSIVVSTIHGLANRMVMPKMQEWKLYSKTDWIFEIVLSNRTAVNRFGTGLAEEFDVEDAQLAVVNAKNSGLKPAECEDRMVGRIYSAYESFKTKRKILDFDDLLIKAVDFMQNDQDFARQFQSRFSHVSVDEFQDVNILQWDLLQLMAEPQKNLFVVGDFRQSIYGFRGARPELILEFSKYYPDAKTILLDRNYRSTEPVIFASNRVIALNSRKVKGRIIANRRGGEPVRTLPAYDDFEQAYRVADTIASLRTAFSELKWSDFAILSRTNSEAMPFEEVFVERHIPYELADARHFFENVRIQPIIAYMRVSEALRQNELPQMDDLIMTLKNPKGVLQHSAIERVQIEGMGVMGEDTSGAYDAYLDNLAELETDRAPAAFVSKLGEMYPGLVKVQSGETWYGSFMRVLNKFTDLTSFLAHVDYAISQAKEPKDDAVRIMSIHASKGLEFRTVFIANVVEGLLPYQKSVDTGNVDEETRLFYVAMTRAMDRLYLGVPKLIGEKPVTPSRYVEELRGGKKK